MVRRVGGQVMRDRFERIASRMVKGMTDFEKEGWEDRLKMVVRDMGDVADEMEEGDLEGLGVVEQGVAKLRREQRNLDLPLMSREVDGVIGEVQKLLNEAEMERRRHEDEGKRYLGKCKELGRKARDLKDQFTKLEGRI
jgi:hypothetical protein